MPLPQVLLRRRPIQEAIGVCQQLNESILHQSRSETSETMSQPPTNFGQAAGSAGVPPDAASSAPMLQQPPAPPGPEALQQLLVQNQHRQAQLAHQTLPVAPSSSSAAAAPAVQPPAPTAVPSSAPAAAADPLKRLPIRAYLDQTVVPILLDGTLRALSSWFVSDCGLCVVCYQVAIDLR
jgi:hypothetical protein